MMNLSQINEATKSTDGSTFSDLFKDCYGYRPTGTLAMFATVEEFDAEYKRLATVVLPEVMDEEAQAEARNQKAFIARVEETMGLVQGTDKERAIHIIADAEDEAEAVQWYGWERLEWHFNLGYGFIKKYLGE